MEHIFQKSVKRKKEADEKEVAFQEVWKEWKSTGSKAAHDKMFTMMVDCSKNVILKLLKGIPRNDVEELALDATVRAWPRITKWDEIKKLSSALYFDCLYILRNDKRVFQDKLLTFTDAGLDEKGNKDYGTM